MQSLSIVRTRWAAIGAAVAIALGAGGIGFVNATVTSGERTVFVPITPCRLLDTRPEFQVGPKSSPLGANEVHSVAGVGSVGNCNLPANAVALVLNVTALDATLPTFLAVWPAGVARPEASSLNPAPGQPPMPNAVTTDLGTNNEFSIFNLQGTVNVLADVVGYYADHNHDDRYYQKSQTYTQAEVNNAINTATAPAPWRVDLGTADFANPSTTDFWPGASAGDWKALAYANAFGRAYYSFRLPDDYVAGADIRATFDWTWIPSGFGLLVAPCQFVAWAEQFGVGRPGSAPFYVSAAMDVPVGPVDQTTLAVTAPLFAGGPLTQTAAFEISGATLRPGDRLSGSLARRGADAADTCTGGLAVFGMTIRNA